MVTAREGEKGHAIDRNGSGVRDERKKRVGRKMERN